MKTNTFFIFSILVFCLISNVKSQETSSLTTSNLNRKEVPACLYESFENTYVSVNQVLTGTTVEICNANSNHISGSFNNDPTNIPLGVNATIVGNNNIYEDPYIASLSGVGNNPEVDLRLSSEGNSSVRINQNHEFESGAADNAEEDILYKSFRVISPFLTFTYATVFDYDSILGREAYPYFKAYVVRVDSNNNVIETIDEFCIDGDKDFLDHEGNNFFETPLHNPNGSSYEGDETVIYSEWKEASFNLECYLGQILQVRFEVGDCNQQQHGAYAYIDEISNCIDCTDIEPEIETQIDACYVDFYGNNLGSQCNTQSYLWSIDGVNVSTLRNFDYEFLSSGSYNVCLTISYQGCSVGLLATETICEEITVNCDDDCDDCIQINVEGNQPGNTCTGAIANLKSRCQDDVNSIDWYWSLNGVTTNNPPEIYEFIETSTNPSAPTTAVNWNGDYSNHLLFFKAVIHYNDGSSCESIEQVLLECDNAGNGEDDGKFSLIPNPTTGLFSITANKENLVASYSIVNMFGVSIQKNKYDVNTTIDLSDYPKGIYFILVKYKNGSFENKQLLLTK